MKHIYNNADTVEGIKNAVSAGLDVSVNTPLCKKNADYIKTLELIKSLGVSFVTISGLICTGMAEINHEEYDLSAEALFEIVKEATENAENLKKINNLHNLTNINGDCAKEIPRLSKELGGDFAVVVDPPRKGLDKPVVDAMLEAKPKQIVYLSCNPATLARDLAILLEKYDLDFVQPYDMFPQTANVETLVCLNIKK